MTAKEFVKQHYPNARAESHYAFALLRKVKYWLIRDGNSSGYMANGETEAKAWKNAKIFVQQLKSENK